jgi:NTP pyrophosphatase (non-canonical NTP hydrolase)
METRDLSLNRLREKIRSFNLERDWDRFHNPKDLVLALVGEVGELAECYNWLSEEEINNIHLNAEKRERIEEEMADILIYLLTLSYKNNIDILKAVNEKIKKNKEKYPVKKAKTRHTNKLLAKE